MNYTTVTIEDWIKLGVSGALPLLLMGWLIFHMFAKLIPTQMDRTEQSIKEMQGGYRESLEKQEAYCERRLEMVLQAHNAQLCQSRTDFLGAMQQERQDNREVMEKLSAQYEKRLDQQANSLRELGELILIQGDRMQLRLPAKPNESQLPAPP